MSFRAVAWALDDIVVLSAAEKLTLVCLAEFANDENQTWRSREAIAHRVGCSKRTLITHLQKLETLGLISLSARYAWCGSDDPQCASRGAHKHRAGTLYTIHVGSAPTFTLASTSTSAEIAPVEQTAEISGKTHKCKNCTCEENQSHRCKTAHSTGEKPSTHMNIDPPLHNPPDPTQTLPSLETAEDHPDAACSQGQVRSGQEKPNEDALTPTSQQATNPSSEDAHVIAQCLPEAMRTLDSAGAHIVGILLRQRLKAGWTPTQIRQLMDQPLPPQVHRLSALVATRLKVNVQPHMAPNPAAQAITQAAQAAREAKLTQHQNAMPREILTDQQRAEHTRLADAQTRIEHQLEQLHPEWSRGQVWARTTRVLISAKTDILSTTTTDNLDNLITTHINQLENPSHPRSA